MNTAIATNRTQRNEVINAYILGCIDSDGYDVTTTTDKEKVQFLIDTFNKEYNHAENKRYYGHNNTQRIFTEWCKGLPSCFNIEFTNYDILQLGAKWGMLDSTASESKKDTFINNYWNGLYMAVKRVAKLNKIQF